jgi:protoheme IX farnesyltransferase
MQTIRTYYSLSKPGIIYGNALNAIAGFLLASRGNIHFSLFIAMLSGTSLIIASACVFNNYLDRHIDKAMARTRNRALVKKTIPTRNALLYATVLGIIGIAILAGYTNMLTVIIGLTGFVIYVVVYGISKRQSVHGTIIGSIAGATPPVAGYCAVTNQFDAGAILLFIILVAWQMPHFYAISLYRLKDYREAAIPLLPVKTTIHKTKVHMLAYAIIFLIATLGLPALGYTGYTYLVIIALVGMNWVRLCILGFTTDNTMQWARKVFFFSLVITVVFALLLATDVVLP